jgi:hypothetical protein
MLTLGEYWLAGKADSDTNLGRDRGSGARLTYARTGRFTLHADQQEYVSGY